MSAYDRIVLAAEENVWTFDDAFHFDTKQTGHRHPNDLSLVKWVDGNVARVNVYFDPRGRIDEMVLRTRGRVRFARDVTEVVAFLRRPS